MSVYVEALLRLLRLLLFVALGIGLLVLATYVQWVAFALSVVALLWVLALLYLLVLESVVRRRVEEGADADGD